MSILRTKCDLALEVDGVRFEVSYFECTYSLNQIPTASCVLAIGRSAHDGITAAKSHAELPRFKKMTACKVLFSAEGEYSKDIDWPSGEFVIFEGRITGLGYQKVNGKVQLAANLVHWLGDLNSSSTVSSRSHPSNPSQYTFDAVLGPALSAGGSGSATSAPYALAGTAESEYIDVHTVSDDLWGGAIKPLFCALATQESLELNSELTDCFGETDGKNEQALAALRRIEGETDLESVKEYNLALSCYTPKLSMELPGKSIIPISISNAVSTAILQETIQSFIQQTFWGKLVGELAPSFMFSLVPQAERALVVPFVPGLRETYCKEISPDDYDHVDLSAVIQRPIRGTAVLSGYKWQTGGIASADRSSVAVGGVGGCFAPEGADIADGMIYYIGAPAWLQNVTTSGLSPLRSSGIGARLAGGSSTTPVESVSEELKADEDGATPSTVIRGSSDMYNGYAQTAYVIDALRGRNGQLSGKLRFDIAPGSTVRIGGSAEQFLLDSDKLGQSLYASVVRVTITINAETGKAGTGLIVSHVRTEKENEDDRTSVAKHPLYETMFTGAPIVPELGFAEEGNDCCFK